MAYVVVTRKDPSIDRVPQVSMDMQFDDQTGPVTLVLPSNTPPLATGDGSVARPVQDLVVSQIIDTRDAQDRVKDRTIKLEVQFRGKGVVPELRDVLAGVETAIDGYEVAADGIEAKPTLVLQEGEANTGRFYWGPPTPPKSGYPEPDASGMYRLTIERSWVVTYRPGSGALGSAFRVPALMAGAAAKLESRYYSDFDLVPVSGPSVAVRPHWLTPARAALGGAILLGLAALGWVAYRRSRRVPAVEGERILPDRITPLSTVMTLHRLRERHGATLGAADREALERDIAGIERAYFGPGDAGSGNGDLRGVLERWAGKASGG
jgi:hypothetical protein